MNMLTIVHFKCVNYMVCELHLNKMVIYFFLKAASGIWPSGSSLPIPALIMHVGCIKESLQGFVIVLF